MSKLKTVEIKDFIYPNLGIGYYGDQKDREIRVKNALVGQRVEAIAGRRRKDYRKGKLYQVLEKSPMETEEGCIHKDTCGGCVYQSLTYENELDYKKSQIEKLYKKYQIDSIIPSPSPLYYRNKMEYTFGDEYKGSPLALGMHAKNRFYEIVNTDNCLIVHEDFNIIQRSVRDYFQELGLDHYHKKHRTGNLRHLSVRRSSLGQIMVNLVVTHDTVLDLEAFVKYLRSLDLQGQIKSIYITYNDSPADAVVPEKVQLIYGQESIEEEILGLKFNIGPFTFFQTNTQAAELLYSEAIAMLDDIEGKVIYDLYSGTGTITQILASKTCQIYGIEIVEESVEKARESAKLNQIENVTFIQGDVLEKLSQIEENPDTIVLDPPREGIVPKSLEQILSYGVEEILYISCNPVTQYRDLQVMEDYGYKIQTIKLLDQFPRTSHCECVVLMSRK